MANYVQIANLCGSFIGTESHITDPNDDRTLARKIKAVWDIERRATIRDGEWNFSIRRAALPALVPSVALVTYPYENAFTKPAECLRILEILNSRSNDDYSVEGNVILANSASPLYLRFLIDEPNSSLWDESFAVAFAARLAWSIGESIAGSAYNKEDGWQTYQSFLSQAKSTDARENPPLRAAESGWITARWGGTDDDTSWV